MVFVVLLVQSSLNVMVHDDALEGKWRGNWRMELVIGTLQATSEHGVSSITTADAHTSAASSRLNWRLRQFKWTRPFRRKMKSGFCACAITFQTQSTSVCQLAVKVSVCWKWSSEVNISPSCRTLRSLNSQEWRCEISEMETALPQQFLVVFITQNTSSQTHKYSTPQTGRLELSFCFV